jgi:hypothetical protein
MILVDKCKPSVSARARTWIAECDVCFKQEVALCRRFSTLQRRLAVEGWFFGARGAIVCASCLAQMTQEGERGPQV